ncbi:MAG: AAA family ATPase [Candidatus Saccharimonadales bacterium]
MSSLNEGSVWRKWDLQVQTRLDQNYTCLGNSLEPSELDKLATASGLTSTEIKAQEMSMSAEKYAKLFVNYIGLFTDINVIAITDHNNGKDIDLLLQEVSDSPYDLTILPGIEVASNHGIHILCVFDSEKCWKDNWESAIDHFLTEIGLTSSRFNASKQPLNASASSQEILDLVSTKNGVSIFAHINTSRGLFMQSNTANGGTAHSDIYLHEHCQIVQVPHSGNLSSGTVNIINGKDPQYGNKSVTKIKCSDSRKLSDIGSQFCWIKSDATLNGLKQVIYEPTLRVKIQDTNPYEDNQKLALSSFSVEDGSGFKISDQTIPLNRDLVAIIGGRGSGKSLLLETIAVVNESHGLKDNNGKPKVIESYRNLGATAKISLVLKDKNGNEESFSKNLTEHTKMDLPVLYIGQEELSSIATDDKNLTPTITAFLGIENDIIESDKIEGIITHDLSQIEHFSTLLNELEEKYTKLFEVNDKSFLEKLKDYRLKKESQIKRLSSTETEVLVKKLRVVIEQGQKIKNVLERLPTLEAELKVIANGKSIEATNKLLADIPALEGFTIPTIEITAQLEAIKNSADAMEKEKKELTENYHTILEELKRQGVKEDVRLLTESIRKLQDEINDIDADAKSYETAILELDNYREELKAMGQSLSNLVGGRVIKINEAFQNFVNTNELSDEDEQQLFSSIIKGVGVEGEITFDETKLIKILIDECFDSRTAKDKAYIRKAIMGDDGVQPITFKGFIDFWKSGLIWPLLEKLKFNKYGNVKFIDVIFNRWNEYISVRTKISLDNIPVENLSLGQRGTLLLKIYLASATDKQIFIIDQPEDNLDNKFITNEMVPMLRAIKQSRQVILSTHNANIVVGCDADQVIVARLDEKKKADRKYASGSIESEDINHYIQTILEGGSEALAHRYRRYVS